MKSRRKKITEEIIQEKFPKWIVMNFQIGRAQVRSRMNGNKPALRHIAGILEAKRRSCSFQRRGKDDGQVWKS